MKPDPLDRILTTIQMANPGKTRKQIVEYLLEGALHYANEAKKYWKTKDERHGCIDAFHHEVDKTINEQPPEVLKEVKCKKGCAACCHIQVDITKAEGEFIYDYCKSTGIDIDKDYLQRQQFMKKADYNKGVNNRCVFLDDDKSCKIYEQRPMVCRKYLVSTDPIYCDTVLYPSFDKVASLLIIKNEIMFYGLVQVEGETNAGTLPQILLKVIRENET